jgi:hypothetical protein
MLFLNEQFTELIIYRKKQNSIMPKKMKIRKKIKKVKRIEIKKDVITEKTIPPLQKRPVGITIVCALGLVLSVLLIIVGIFAFALADYAGALVAEEMAVAATMLFRILGAVSFALGVVGFVAFYLLFKMKRTGWIIVTVVGFLAIISGILSLAGGNLISVVSVIIWILIVGYLWTQRKVFT